MNSKEESAERFQAELRQVTLESQLAYWDRRASLALEGPASICRPAPPGVLPHAPFHNGKDYAHYKNGVINFHAEYWKKLRAMHPKDVFSPMLSGLSDARTAPGDYLGLPPESATLKYQAWDAAAAIAACAIRKPGARHPRDIQSVRNCNTFYMKNLSKAMLNVGPLGADGAQARPSGRYLWDLSKMDPYMSHKILEVAHVLAHLRADTHKETREYATALGKSAGHLRGIVAEIKTAIEFDLPIDVSARNADRAGEPDLPFGLGVLTTTRYHQPLMRVPMYTPESPRFDNTLAMSLVTVYLEPVPYAFVRREGAAKPLDCWSCMPTILGLCGWEGIDVITHMDIGRSSDKAPECWFVRAEDLLEPEYLWNYFFEMYNAMRPDGKPQFPSPSELANIPGGRWWYIDDWIKTADYEALLSATPPFPCRMCIDFNPESEYSPKRPRGPRPGDAPRERMPKPWREYYDQVDQIHALLIPVVESHEVHLFGGSRVRVRAARAKAHRAKLDAMTAHDRMKGQAILRKQHALTERQEKKFQAYQTLHGPIQ